MRNKRAASDVNGSNNVDVRQSCDNEPNNRQNRTKLSRISETEDILDIFVDSKYSKSRESDPFLLKSNSTKPYIEMERQTIHFSSAWKTSLMDQQNEWAIGFHILIAPHFLISHIHIFEVVGIVVNCERWSINWEAVNDNIIRWRCSFCQFFPFSIHFNDDDDDYRWDWNSFCLVEGSVGRKKSPVHHHQHGSGTDWENQFEMFSVSSRIDSAKNPNWALRYKVIKLIWMQQFTIWKGSQDD